jgi:hypothetical protein
MPYQWTAGGAITPALQVALMTTRMNDPDTGTQMPPGTVDYDVEMTATLADGTEFVVTFTVPAGADNFVATDVHAAAWNVPAGVLDTSGTKTLATTKLQSGTAVLLDSTALGSNIQTVTWTYS